MSTRSAANCSQKWRTGLAWMSSEIAEFGSRKLAFRIVVYKLQLRLERIAFLDFQAFVVLPAAADWRAFNRVTVERHRGRRAPSLPSEEDMLTLLRREAECRSS